MNLAFDYFARRPLSPPPPLLYCHNPFSLSVLQEGEEEDPVLRGVRQTGGPKAGSNHRRRKCSVAGRSEGYALR